jgi:predicted transglutaminase-like cysteine proteinase
MQSYSRARAWRAALVLLAAALLAPASVVAGPLQLHQLVGAPNLHSEPFGLVTRAVADGGLVDKWNGVRAKLDGEQREIAACRDDRPHCTNGAVIRILAIVDVARERDGLARLGEINRAVNLAIRPMSDLANYGEEDVWASPLMTLTRGAGDCEDYAIAKMAALKAAGIRSEDLRLVILRATARAEDHAVLAVRLQERWVILDNRTLVMLSDSQLANYRPTFVIDEAGVRAYRNDPAPAPLLQVQPYEQDIAYLISAQADASI